MNNILTKVNSFTPSFKQVISGRTEAPFITLDELENFVKFVHGNKADYAKDGNVVMAYTSKGQYYYSCYGKVIHRTHLDTQKRKCYNIS